MSIEFNPPLTETVNVHDNNGIKVINKNGTQLDVKLDATGNTVKLDSSNNKVKITDGTHDLDITAQSALKVDGSAVTQPVSGSVTATISNTPAVTLSGTANSVRVLDNGGLPINSTNAFPVSISSFGSNNHTQLEDGGGTGQALSIRTTAVQGITYGLIYQRKAIRGSSSSYYDERTADRWNYSEYLNLTNNTNFSIFAASNGFLTIKIKKIMLRVSHAGIYVIYFDTGAGTFTLLKTFLNNNTPYTFDFSDGVIANGLGGNLRLVNNAGSNSDVQTTVIGWEE